MALIRAMHVPAKICGLSTRETVEAAVASGAGFVGFNFFPASPRYGSAPSPWTPGTRSWTGLPGSCART